MLQDDVEGDLQDVFHFDVMDAKPNIVKGNVFHIRWSRVYLTAHTFNVTETAGVVQVPVGRAGNLKQVKKETLFTLFINTQFAVDIDR